MPGRLSPHMIGIAEVNSNLQSSVNANLQREIEDQERKFGFFFSDTYFLA